MLNTLEKKQTDKEIDAVLQSDEFKKLPTNIQQYLSNNKELIKLYNNVNHYSWCNWFIDRIHNFYIDSYSKRMRTITSNNKESKILCALLKEHISCMIEKKESKLWWSRFWLGTGLGSFLLLFLYSLNNTH
jgi:hypothetical protein